MVLTAYYFCIVYVRVSIESLSQNNVLTIMDRSLSLILIACDNVYMICTTLVVHGNHIPHGVAMTMLARFMESLSRLVNDHCIYTL